MKKIYLNPVIETLEINPIGVLMQSPDPWTDPKPTPPGGGSGAPKRPF